jgi:hypothetical protein
MPRSPVGASNGGTMRSDPNLMRVGALSFDTSENRNSISKARESLLKLTRQSKYESGRSGAGKLASTCQPVSPGSCGFGDRTTIPPRHSRGIHRSTPTNWSKAACSTAVFAAWRKGSCAKTQAGRLQPVACQRIARAPSAVARGNAPLARCAANPAGQSTHRTRA